MMHRRNSTEKSRHPLAVPITLKPQSVVMTAEAPCDRACGTEQRGRSLSLTLFSLLLSPSGSDTKVSFSLLGRPSKNDRPRPSRLRPLRRPIYRGLGPPRLHLGGPRAECGQSPYVQEAEAEDQQESFFSLFHSICFFFSFCLSFFLSVSSPFPEESAEKTEKSREEERRQGRKGIASGGWRRGSREAVHPPCRPSRRLQGICV